MNNIVKIEKTYFRINIKEVITDKAGKPIIVTDKYKHNHYNKWIIFTTVRSYISALRTYTLCNHMNILRTDIGRYINLSEEFHNRKFYIIGYPNIYNHFNAERDCIYLAHDVKISPIGLSTDIDKLDNSILKEFYIFSSYIYKRCIEKNNNKYLKE